MGFYSSCVKRPADLLAALGLLLVLSPPIALVALAILVNMGRPVLFRQERPGLNGVPFTLFKFRTMTPVAEGAGVSRADAERLTGLGRLLRAASLDELPELWNVVRGEMSLVGPRPLLLCYLDRYTPEQARRHRVRPGITGWAQVNGRNAIGWKERLGFDVWYVDHIGLWLDVRILWLTPFAVLGAKGIAAAGHATMPEFFGDAPDGR